MPEPQDADATEASPVPRMFQGRFSLPPGAAQLVVVRHGTPMHEVLGDPFPRIEGGHSDPPLSPDGRRQAEAVARRLAGEQLAEIVVTPLRRTAETAAPLADKTGLTPLVVTDLRETSLGLWESGEFDRRAAAGDPLVPQIFAAERWDVIPGAESREHFGERVARGLRLISERLEPGGNCVAFLHGGVIAELCSQVTGSRGFAFLFAENGSITRLIRLASGTWRLRTFNDVAHLENAARDASGRA